MLKTISDLKGAKVLSKDEQKNVIGGDLIIGTPERCAYDNYSAANGGCPVQHPDLNYQQPTCIYRCVNGRWVKYPY